MKQDTLKSCLFLVMTSCSMLGNIINNTTYYFQGLDINIYNGKFNSFIRKNTIKNIENINKYLNATKGKIYNIDYRDILEKSKKGDFVFLDPPYMEEHNYHFQYNKGEALNNEFYETLLTELEKLDKKK